MRVVLTRCCYPLISNKLNRAGLQNISTTDGGWEWEWNEDSIQYVQEMGLMGEEGSMNGRIQTLDKDFLWVNASARLHEGMDAFKNNKPSLTGVGPGLFLAKNLTEMIDDQNDESNVNVNLIPCAKRASTLDDWDPNADTEYYQNMMNRIRKSEKKVNLFVWWQGEQDGLEQVNAEKYGAQFQTFVEVIRQELDDPDLPFLVVKPLGQKMKYPYIEIVVDQVEEAVKNIDNATLVDLDLDTTMCVDVDTPTSKVGLRGDCVHLTLTAQKEMGHSMATAAMQSIVLSEPPQCKTFVEIAAGNPDFSILYELVVLADLADTLSGFRGTVFGKKIVVIQTYIHMCIIIYLSYLAHIICPFVILNQ